MRLLVTPRREEWLKKYRRQIGGLGINIYPIDKVNIFIQVSDMIKKILNKILQEQQGNPDRKCYKTYGRT